MTAPDDPEALRANEPPEQRVQGRVASIRSSTTARLEELRSRSDAVALAAELWERDRASVGRVLGSAIAFRLFLFVVPMMVLTVGLAGIASRVVTAEQVNDSAGLSGVMSEQIRQAFRQSGRAPFIAVALGLFGSATAGRSLANVLIASSAVAWGASIREQKVPLRLTAALIGMLGGLALAAVTANRISVEAGPLVALVAFAIAAVIYTACWLFVAASLPRATNDPMASFPGAILVGITLALMQAITQLLVPNQLQRASTLYGGLAVATVTLGWFFFIGRAIAAGFALDATVHHHTGSSASWMRRFPLARRIEAWFSRRSPRQ